MQLKYGSYSFNANACKLQARTKMRLNGYGKAIANCIEIKVEGFLQADGEAAVSSSITALYAALETPYQDLIFYKTDGSESATFLKNAGSLTGVVIHVGPDFLENTGYEYNQGRKFEFTAKAEYPYAGAGSTLLRYREEIHFSGGGPLYIVRPAKVGLAQRQKVYANTPYLAIQTGEAFGYMDYPPLPTSIWPGMLKQTGSIRKVGGERVGTNGYENFGYSWEFIHESPVPLAGVPKLWVG